MRKWVGLVVGVVALAAVATSASCTLSIQGEGDGVGTVMIEPGGYVCDIGGGADPDCFQDVPFLQDDYTLTAEAGVDSDFGAWSGDCDEVIGNVCYVHFDSFDQHFVVTVSFTSVAGCSVEVESQGDDPPVEIEC